uniref:Uncharacterized protein n=1 Tax=Oryza glaberrima TaxID=4538 RepID=I1NZG5_ORYGL
MAGKEAGEDDSADEIERGDGGRRLQRAKIWEPVWPKGAGGRPEPFSFMDPRRRPPPPLVLTSTDTASSPGERAPCSLHCLPLSATIRSGTLAFSPIATTRFDICGRLTTWLMSSLSSWLGARAAIKLRHSALQRRRHRVIARARCVAVNFRSI